MRKEDVQALCDFLPDDTVVCIKDPKGSVLWQNDPCTDLCGDVIGNTCVKNCMEYYQEVVSETSPPTKMKVKRVIEGRRFDLVLTANEFFVVSLLFPHDTKIAQRIKSLDEFNLTKQETKIVGLALQGYTNSEIGKELRISRETVRTHLRRIYQKVPNDLFPKRGKDDE